MSRPPERSSGASGRRKFDESKVKRDRGRFAKKAGPKLVPGDTVTNANGQTGQVLGRTPDGRLIVQRKDGSRAYWVPAEVRKRHPRFKSAPGKSGGGGFKSARGKGGGGGGGGGGKGGGGGGGKSKSDAERRKVMRFLEKVSKEQAAAKAEGRAARLFVGDDYDAVADRFRKSGLPVRTVNGVMVVGFPDGPVEVRPGRRLRKDGATREEIDAEKARKVAERERERATKRAARDAERADRQADQAADRVGDQADRRRQRTAQERDQAAREADRVAKQAERDAEWAARQKAWRQR